MNPKEPTEIQTSLTNTDPPHEILDIFTAVMTGRKSCRKAWHDIDEVYKAERTVLLRCLDNLTTVLREAGAPLNPDGDMAPLIAWAKSVQEMRAELQASREGGGTI